MTEPTPAATSGGVSALGLLQVALIVLKLCHVINWSWWWVWSPTWGLAAATVVIVAVAVLVALLADH